MRISDWSSDVCSSDLPRDRFVRTGVRDDAIAVGEEARGAKRGVMSHGALPHAAWANGATIVPGVSMPVLASRSGVSASRSIRNAACVAPLHMRGGPSLSQCQPIAMTCARKLADTTPGRDMMPEIGRAHA